MNIRDLKIYIGETITFKGHKLRLTEVTSSGAILMRTSDGAVASVTLEKLSSLIFQKINS